MSKLPVLKGHVVRRGSTFCPAGGVVIPLRESEAHLRFVPIPPEGKLVSEIARGKDFVKVALFDYRFRPVSDDIEYALIAQAM